MKDGKFNMRPVIITKRLWWFAVRTIRGTRYRQLFDEIDRTHPANIMEIGTWNADNAVKMITAAGKHRKNQEINYYGFDLFEEMTDELFLQEVSKRPPSMDAIEGILKQTGAKINLYKGNTNETLPDILPQLPTMDLIFIDGGHSVQTIGNDWNLISQYVSEQTTVIFDDYWVNKTSSGCKLIVDEIDQSKYRVEVLPTTDNYYNADFGHLQIKLVKIQGG